MNRLDRPIFFIGVPRSGTTIIFEVFARHEALAWPSAYSNMYPKLPFLNVLRVFLDNRVIMLGGKKKQHAKVLPGNRYLPMPDEAYEFWDEYAGPNFSRSYLLDVEASEDTRKRVNLAVAKIIRWQRRRRFVAKFTGPARIKFLRSLFPDAIFIHVVRDGESVVNSLLGVDFWRRGGLSAPWWENGLPESYVDLWQRNGGKPSVLAALQWRYIIESAREEASELEEGAYCEVSYSTFSEQPEQAIESLIKFAKLEPSSRVKNYVRSIPQRSASINKNIVFDAAEKSLLSDICSPVRVDNYPPTKQVSLILHDD